MTPQEIAELYAEPGTESVLIGYIEELIAAEREACAKLAESRYDMTHFPELTEERRHKLRAGRTIAEDIRARK